LLPEDKVKALFIRFLNNDCTEEETAMLMREFAGEQNGDILKSLVRARLEHMEGEEDHSAAVEAVYERITQHIHQESSSPAPRYLLWRRIAVAASIGLLLGPGSLWFLHRQKTSHPIVAIKQSTTDFSPGREKAVLTLADGSTIALDSAGVGLLAQQGNTSVTSLKNGQLIYAAAGKQQEVLFNNIATPKGGSFQVTLSDGTKVWLNAASAIRFPTVFTGQQREVEVKGEVYFEVAQHASMPFMVKSGNAMVKVLGTQFNVNAYPDETEMKITLLAGKVAVSTTADQPTHILTPGQQAEIKPDNNNIYIKEGVDLGDIMAWKDNLFSFNNADIKTIMRQLSRWYNIEVEYEGTPPSREFSGKISRNTNASNVISILEQSNIHFRMGDGKIVVTP